MASIIKRTDKPTIVRGVGSNAVLRPSGLIGPAGPSGGPIPAGGSPGMYPTPLAGGGYVWDDPAATYAGRSARGRGSIQGKTGKALRTFHAALANVALAPVDILCIGDSIVEGSKATNTETRWQARLRDHLRAAYQPAGIAGGVGYYPMYYAGGQFPDAWTYTGGSGTNDDFGLGMRSKYLAGNTVSAKLTATCTSFKLLYTQAFSTGSFTVKIDGATVATVNTGGFADVTSGVAWTSAALVRGKHTIEITPVDTTQVSIEGVMVYDGDENAGVRVWDGGRSGSTANQWLTDNNEWHEAIATVAPELVIIGLGRNDWSTNVTVTDFKTRMRSLIDTKIRAQAPNTSLAFVVQHETASTTATTTWASFAPAVYELAEEYDAAVVDLNERFGPGVASAAPFSLVDADAIHLTDKGSQLYADAIMQDLVPLRPPQRPAGRLLRPYVAAVENFPRLGAALTSLDLALSGRLLLSAIHLDPCLVSAIGFVSGTRAAATPTNQWFALYDANFNKLATTNDDTTAAWAASTVKKLNLTTAYRVLTPGLYYLGVNVTATTTPTFLGVSTFNGGPQLAGSDTVNTGLTTPATAPAVATLTAQASHPYAFVG